MGYRGVQGTREIRQGLLYALLAGVLYYFAAGHSPLKFPGTIAPMLTDWVLPLLFLGGLGLVVYGAYCRYTA